MNEIAAILKLAISSLKSQGFRTKSLTASRATPEEGNILVVTLQRSSKSTTTEALIAINYGVISKRIADAMGQHMEPIDVFAAHWQRRYEENGQERWLPVRASDEPQAAAHALVAAIESGLPELNKYATDAALRDLFLSDRSPGLTKLQRLLYVCILLRALGPEDLQAAAVARLRAEVAGTPHEGLTEGRIERLNLQP
jgi:hypothetical protein